MDPICAWVQNNLCAIYYGKNLPKASIFCRDEATTHGKDCEQSDLTKVRAFSCLMDGLPHDHDEGAGSLPDMLVEVLIMHNKYTVRYNSLRPLN